MPPGRWSRYAQLTGVLISAVIVLCAYLRPSNSMSAGATVAPSRGGAEPLPAMTPGERTIRGQVLDALERPVAYAIVTAKPDAGGRAAGTVTDSDGRYRLVTAPGRYTIEAEKMPWAAGGYGQVTASDLPAVVAVDGAPDRDGLQIRLANGAVVSGTVVDAAGTPVVGASVQLLERGFSNTRPVVSTVRLQSSMRSDDKGRFRLFGVAPGSYIVAAVPPEGYSAVLPGAHLGYRRTFIPGVSSMDRAEPVLVSADRETTIAIRLVRDPVLRLRGRVTTNDERVAPTGMARLLKVEGGEATAVAGASLASDGSFLMEAAASPGVYTVGVLTGLPNEPGQRRERELGRAEITWRGDGELAVHVKTAPGAVVRGRVTTKGQVDARALRVFVLPTSAADSWIVSPSVALGPGGAFEVRGVFAPSHLLVASERDADVVQRTSRNGRDFSLATAGVNPGTPVDGVEIEVSRASAGLAGVVGLSGACGPHPVVVAFAEDKDRWADPRGRFIKTARAGSDGHYRIDGLAPGAYRVATLRSIPRHAVTDPARLSKLQRRATKVVLGDKVVAMDLPMSCS
jgi:protocatechuate 3,4-dioxygenase beta subunit